MSDSLRAPSLPHLKEVPSYEEAVTWPRTWEATVDPSFIDTMGHMNVSRYVQLFDNATWVLFAQVGIDRAYIRDRQAGMFAVEHHLRYLGELRAGEALAIHSKVLMVRERGVDYVNVMIDPVRRRVASVAEIVGLHIDLRTRRTAPLAPEIAAAFRAMIAPQG